MNLYDVRDLVQAEVLCGSSCLSRKVSSICGADLMSDVLALNAEDTLLLTALVNIQVIRTAEMSDLVGVVFVKGKRPGADIIKMAADLNIPIMVTDCSMYEACGLLYGCSIKEKVLR